jgi:hypothetical protein
VAAARAAFPRGLHLADRAHADDLALLTRWPMARNHVRACRWCDVAKGGHHDGTHGQLLCRHCYAAWHRGCLGAVASGDGDGAVGWLCPECAVDLAARFDANSSGGELSSAAAAAGARLAALVARWRRRA